MGSPLPNPSDRRVIRTRRSLREALVELLHERRWEEIAVQDICARADVGRSTFYLHFADKEELLAGGFDDLGRVIRATLDPAGPTATPLRFARGLLEHALENRRLFRALVGQRSGQVVLRRFRALVLDLVAEDLATHAPPTPTREAAAHFLAGAFLELLTWSLEGRTGPGAAELDAWFGAMAGSALSVSQEV